MKAHWINFNFCIWSIIPFVLFLSCNSTPAMTFSVESNCLPFLKPTCPKYIFAQGIIDKDSLNAFLDASKDLPTETYVAFSSPGGNLVLGLKLGLAIREKQFNTIIVGSDFGPANCMSACAYSFLGGVTRHIPSSAKIGLHQFRGHEGEISAADSQQILAVISKYLDEMGVDRHFEDLALQTKSDKILVLTIAQAKALRVENFEESPYPKWRLEANNQGKLLLMNSLKTKNGQIIHFAFVKSDQGPLVALIYYRNNDELAFITKTNHQFDVLGKSFEMIQASEWKKVGQGFQAIFALPEKLHHLLGSISEDTTFKLSATFSKAPSPNPSNRIEALGGITGLKNGLLAIK